MLNISKNSIKERIDTGIYRSFTLIHRRSERKRMTRLLLTFGAGLLIILFVPWNQNIRGGGTVTTLYPDQRPQTINSVIAGRIDKWFVKEGDFVSEGDTLLRITETKDAYLDPDLLERVRQQLGAKEASLVSYSAKVKALESQIEAMKISRELKLEQMNNKISQSELKLKSDSIEMLSYEVNLKVAEQQFERMKQLYEEGLKSLTEYESREMKLQKANADFISGKNKFMSSRNELQIARVEYQAVQAKFLDDLAKTNSEKQSALSARYEAENELAKLKNQLSSYEIRSGYYLIKAPANGYVTRIFYNGMGEILKEGQELLSIMPEQYDLAVELYVKPLNIPLLEIGQDVRIQFDGWPAVVFSGWPNTSYGTFGGKIYAIDKFISPNGKFRVLVAPDPAVQPWPESLNIGGGTDNMILLKEVPVWYELWRQINGFPPDYYKNTESNEYK